MTKKQDDLVLEQLSEWKDSFIQCRDWGHNWRLVNVVDRRRSIGCVEQEFICRSCTSLKFRLVGAQTGEILENKYKYAKGYLRKRVKDAEFSVTRAEIRVESLQRLLREVSRGKNTKRKAKA